MTRLYAALTRLLCLASITLGACAETGQDVVELPLYLAGSELPDRILTADGTQLELDSAQLAFGPLYLCAGTQAGSLCESARLEWLSSEVIDLLDPTPRRAGELSGVSGPVRSYMYDLGFASVLTREAPLVLPAAQDLDESSVRITGRALLEGVAVPFVAALAVGKQAGGESGVSVVRSSSSQRFERDVNDDLHGLLVRFDVVELLRGVNFSRLAEAHGCLPDGCAEPITFTTSSQAYLALRNALLSGHRPELTWDFRDD